MTAASYALARHPATSCAFLEGVTATLERLPGGRLRMGFHLVGDLSRLRLPAPRAPGPADGLWQHTCCEAFCSLGGEGYREFNFSPSRQWAVYDFSARRERTPAPFPAAGPVIAATPAAGELLLEAVVPPALLPAPGAAIGLTAVVEDVAGGKSYWALAHSAPQPDFHRRETFLATLPPP